MSFRHVRVLTLAAPALAAAASAAAQRPRPATTVPLIPIEAVFGNPVMAEAHLSPDGRSVAYLRPLNGKLNVFVRALAGGAERLVTRDSVRPVTQYWWSADGSRILYLQDTGGDEAYHLFAVDLPGHGAARDLTPFHGVEVDIVAIPRATPGTVVITLNRRDPRLADAYRVDLATGRLDPAAENPGTFLGYVADARAQVRAAYALDSLGHYSLWTRDAERDPWRRIAAYPVEDKITPLRFTPDGRRLWMSSNHGADLLGLARVDLATGGEEVVERDPAGEVDLEGALFDEDTGELLATTYFGDTLRVYPRVPELRRLLAAVRRRGSANLEALEPASGRRRWLVNVDSPTDPGTTLAWTDGRPAARVLFRRRPALGRYVLAQVKPIAFRSRDGLPLHGYLTLPPGGPRRKLPLVLLVHGGPWYRDYWRFDPEAQMYANRGYAVLQVNYRGSTGFGKRIARAARKEFAGAMHRDLLDAVQWAVDAGYADRSRVAIVGGSYGGYAALVGLTFTPDAFACAVDYSGPSNLVTLLESFPPSWAPFLPRSWYPFVGDPRDPADRRDMLARSPLLRADSARAPLLVFQGANDPRVTKPQSDSIALALHRRGIPVTYLFASNEGHGWANEATALGVNRGAEVFLGRCLGGRVQTSVSREVEAAVRGMTVNLDSLARAASR